MADWFIAIEGVKVVKDRASLWPQIITAVSSAGAALGGVCYGQWRITEREKKAAAAKREAELYFISTQLVSRLECFAQGCAEVVNDKGLEDDKGYTRTGVSAEPFSTEDIDGDWRALPSRILYRIRELSVLIPEASRFISIVSDYDNPPDWLMIFKERRYQYSRLDLRALILARRLRRLNAMPSSHLDNNTTWSVQNFYGLNSENNGSPGHDKLVRFLTMICREIRVKLYGAVLKGFLSSCYRTVLVNTG